MSDTPETDQAWIRCVRNAGPSSALELAMHARRLERQRDAYAETLRLMAETDADWAFIRERHPELGNVQVLAPAGKKTPTKP